VEKLKEASNVSEFIEFKKGEVVFDKDTEHSKVIYVLLNSALEGRNVKYEANSIIEMGQLIDKDSFAIKDGVTGV
jgi:hypothetical protein